MSPVLVRRSGVLGWSTLACVLVSVLACGEQSSTTGVGAPPAPPSGGARIVAAVEGTVDATGHVTFAPMAPPTARGVSAQIYGAQNVNVRLYNTPVVVDSTTTPGSKSWSFDVGVRNLLAYPIGSNQGSSAPLDTLGVTVFFTVLPTVTAPTPCAGCSVAVAHADGVGNFTAMGQPYYYWHERLAATSATPGADTTRTRRRFTFTGNAAVTSFRFVVLVGAAWPPPNDTRWTVSYDASTDSLPDTQAAPPWKKTTFQGTSGSEQWDALAGVLTLNAASPQDIYLYRADSLAPAAPTYMEVSMTLTKGAKSDPCAAFGLVDGSRMAVAGIARDRVGFVSLSPSTRVWTFVGTPAAVNAATSHTYRLSKDGTSNATISVDGQPAATMSYASLPASWTVVPGLSALFGASCPNGRAAAGWRYVTYEIGALAP